MTRNLEPQIIKVVLFGRPFGEGFRLYFRTMIARLTSHGAELFIFRDFYEFICGWYDDFAEDNEIRVFANTAGIPRDASVMLSIGGDGTFLEAASLVRDKGIPVAGINAGRLGFLADIAQEEISRAIDSIVHGLYNIEERTLLELQSDSGLFGDYNFALNEMTARKRDDSSMIQIQAYLDGEFLNTYWADGLIVSTPTGSTAYSLSVGGPLVVPGVQDFILSPIAPHNLTVRPIVYPDNMELRLKMVGRGGHVMLSLDSRSVIAQMDLELIIRKAPFSVKTLRLKDHTFYNTLRSKLMWGADRRN